LAHARRTVRQLRAAFAQDTALRAAGRNPLEPGK
jgi:hypothetical protein